MPINRIAHSSTEIDIQNYINLVRTGQSVTDTGWRIYSDTPGVSPVNGGGTSTTNITWSQNIVNPLNGDADLRLVKDTGNRQGQGVSIDFTVDNRHLAKVLQITFDMELISSAGSYLNPITTPISGLANASNSTTCVITANNSLQNGQSVFVTFASNPPANGYYTVSSVSSTTFTIILASSATLSNASCNYRAIGDLRVSIIQDPTSGTPVVIEPVNTDIQLGISNPAQRIRHIATFQTHISIKNYRLCIHVANASTVAYTVDFANFRVWEPQQSIGSIITEPQSYIATIKSQGTPDPSKGSNILTESGSWHREGKHLILRYNLRIGSTPGTAGTGAYFFLLPSGLSIDYTLASGLGGLSGVPVVGSAYVSYGSGQAAGSAVLAGSTSTYPNAIIIVLHANGNVVGQNAYSLGNGDMSYGFQATIPIAGWGSSVAMSSDTGDGRVVSMVARNPATISSADATFIFATVDKDTHGTYSSSTGVYTIPISGDYFISTGYIFPNNTVGTVIYVSIDNNTLNNNGLAYSNSSNVSMNGGRIFSLNAGQTVRIKANQANNGGSNVNSNSYFSINRISAGSQILSASETVAASYFRSSTGNTIAGGSRITFNQRLYDTHGAVTGTASVNDNNWKFTAPMAGKYRIGGMLSGSTINLHVQLWKNDSLFYATVAYLDSMSVTPISYTIDLLAGEFIDLRPLGSVPIGGGTLATSGTSSIVIERIGV